MSSDEIRIPSERAVTAAGTESFVLRCECHHAPEAELPEQARARAFMRAARARGARAVVGVDHEKERRRAFMANLLAECRAGVYTTDGRWIAPRKD